MELHILFNTMDVIAMELHILWSSVENVEIDKFLSK